jgi:hypothetical protein
MQLVAINDLKLDFFVRTNLNEDRVIQMSLMYESDGIKALPPIKITKDKVVIDGRHRIEALRLFGSKEVPVEVDNEKDQLKLYQKAIDANLGGSLPPSTADIQANMQAMIKKGMKSSEIKAWWKTRIGAASADKNYGYAASHLTAANLAKAISAITNDGLTVLEAAAMFGVEVGSIQDKLNGRNKKLNKNAKALNELVNLVGPLNRSVGKTFSHLMQELSRGEADALEIRKYIDKIKNEGEYLSQKASEMYNRLEKA